MSGPDSSGRDFTKAATWAAGKESSPVEALCTWASAPLLATTVNMATTRMVPMFMMLTFIDTARSRSAGGPFLANGDDVLGLADPSRDCFRNSAVVLE